ncbi:MAG: FtsX-like permease family protein [Pseudomonadota bacterium]|nr:FtsX-like permease family protein [Pseudomonadota bacterium]MEC9481561.1 FtsX-like permease family protein [Pseudomonadota bacterium]
MWISRRYLRPKGKEGFFSVITIISFLGIASSVAVLVVVMSVMNGFRTELINKIVNINGHILIHPMNQEGIKDLDPIQKVLSEIDEVDKSIPMIEAQVLAMGETQSSGGLLRGIPANDISKIDIISSNIIYGNILGLSNEGALIGSRLASSLSLSVGDNITIMSPRGISSPFGTIPRSYSYDITGIFEIGMTDYDSSVIFLDLPVVQKFLNLGNVAGVIQVFVDKPSKSISYKEKIDSKLNKFDVISWDWTQTNANLTEMLLVERNVMFLIFALLLIITGLNIVSGLIILVKDRSREISILRAMGMNKLSIARLFVLTGAKIGFFATLIGLFLGVLVSIYVEEIRIFIMSILDITLFSPEVYFLITMPSEIHIPEVISIVILSFTLSILATIYPALRSVAKDPAEALRNE